MPRKAAVHTTQPKPRRGRPPKKTAPPSQSTKRESEPKRERVPTEEDLLSMSIIPEIVQDLPKLEILQNQMHEENGSTPVVSLLAEQPELGSPEWIGKELQNRKNTRSETPARQRHVKKSVRFADKHCETGQSTPLSIITLGDASTAEPVQSILRKPQNTNTTQNLVQRDGVSGDVSADASAERPVSHVIPKKPRAAKATKRPIVSKQSKASSTDATNNPVEGIVSSTPRKRPAKRNVSSGPKDHPSPSVATTNSPASSPASPISPTPTQRELPKRNLVADPTDTEEEKTQLTKLILAPSCFTAIPDPPGPTPTNQGSVESNEKELVNAEEDSSSSSDTLAEQPASPTPTRRRILQKKHKKTAHTSIDDVNDGHALASSVTGEEGMYILIVSMPVLIYAPQVRNRRRKAPSQKHPMTVIRLPTHRSLSRFSQNKVLAIVTTARQRQPRPRSASFQDIRMCKHCCATPRARCVAWTTSNSWS